MAAHPGDSEEYPVRIHLDRWQAIDINETIAQTFSDEQLGTKEKEWMRFADPIAIGDNQWTDREWLCKFVQKHNDGSGRYRGEDWAEWITQHVAEYLHIPHARIMPATIDGRRAVLSEIVLDPAKEEHLVMGNSLLATVCTSIDTTARYQRDHYTIANVREALRMTRAEKSSAGDDPGEGFAMWAGYLVLDAIISGQDRHLENWGIVQAGNERWLAPSYDHGNALGYQENEEKWQTLSRDDGRLEAWARRGRQKYMKGRPSLVSVAVEAVSVAGDELVRHWTQILSGADFSALEPIIETVPMDVMSQASRDFVLKLLEKNRQRVLRELAKKEG